MFKYFLILNLINLFWTECALAAVNCNDEKHLLLSSWIPIKIMESIEVGENLSVTLHWKTLRNHEDDFNSVELPKDKPLISAALSILNNESDVEWYVMAWPSNNNESKLFDDKSDELIVKLNSGLNDKQNGFESYFFYDELFSGSFPSVKPIGCGFNLLDTRS